MQFRKPQLSLLLFTGFLFLTLQASFLAAATVANPLDVVISEIAWMGTTVSANDEWIELYNNTESPINLSGWTLSAADGTPAIALSGAIPASGYFLLERTDDDSAPGLEADQIYTGALGNGGEELTLRDGATAIIDQVNSSSGWFAGHSDGRVPMERINTTLDGNVAGNWNHNPAAARRLIQPARRAPAPWPRRTWPANLATLSTSTSGQRWPPMLLWSRRQWKRRCCPLLATQTRASTLPCTD